MKYRWLDTSKPVRCRGRRSLARGHVGRLVILPQPGCIANCLVNFDGQLVVCPAGTLATYEEVAE